MVGEGAKEGATSGVLGQLSFQQNLIFVIINGTDGRRGEDRFRS